MATTTNFGWETPDDTDLVKDGALAMRTLGNSIDTSFVDLKGGTTGQVLSKTSNTDLDFTWVASAGGSLKYITKSTFTGSTAVNFDNCFSSTYNNYLIVGDWTTSGTAMVNSRYRTSGSNNTNTNYVTSGLYNLGSGLVAENVTLSAFEIGNNGDSTCGFTMNVLSPNLSKRTVALMTNITSGGSFTNIARFYNNLFSATTVFDGISFYPSSGTFTGTITIYGYALS